MTGRRVFKQKQNIYTITITTTINYMLKQVKEDEIILKNSIRDDVYESKKNTPLRDYNLIRMLRLTK